MTWTTDNPKKTGWYWNLLLATCLLIITLAALELTVRLWGYSERHIYDPIYTSFDRGGEIPYVHKPNLTQVRARGLAVINTDSLGLRAKIAGATYGAKLANEYRIAIAGDSCTFGEGVTRTEETFSQVLEDTLNQQQTVIVKVFNYGVSGYSVKEMTATLQYRMMDVQPDLLVMAVIATDFNLARTPTLEKSGYLIDQRLSYFTPPDSIRQVLREIHLMYVLKDIGLLWFSTSKSEDVAKGFSRGEIPESYRYVRQFKRIAEQHGVPYVIVLLPRVQNTPWGSLPDQLEADRISYINLSFLRDEFTQEQYMASRFDVHPSPAVHHRIAETLAAYARDISFKKP